MTATRLTTSSHAGITVLGPEGEFDFSTLSVLRTALNDSLASDGRVILDLSGLTFADSSVLGLFAGSAQQARSTGGWLRLVSPQRPIERMLRITSLDTVLPVFASVELAAAT